MRYGTKLEENLTLMTYLILVVEGGVEDLVLDQLVVAITGRAPRPPALPSAARLAHQVLPLTATRPCAKHNTYLPTCLFVVLYSDHRN
jgi:hypothetical protein